MQNRADLLLRQSKPEDASALADLRADPALQHLLMANPDPDRSVDRRAEAAAWIARREKAGLFRIVDAGDGAIGFVQINDIHYKNRFGYFGMALLPDARGKGFGARALGASETIASSELGLRKLLLHVRADNALAIAVYERAGWRRVGVLLAHYDDGARFHDAVVFEKSLS